VVFATLASFINVKKKWAFFYSLTRPAGRGQNKTILTFAIYGEAMDNKVQKSKNSIRGIEVIIILQYTQATI